MGTLDQQRDNIVASIQALNRLAATFAGQRDVITQALRKIPPALDVLIKERPRLTAALDKLRVFSDTATRLVNDSQADLVKNLQNLEPTISALADVGPELDTAIAAALVFPFTQNFVDRARPRRLLQPACRLGPDDSAAQARTAAWDPLGTAGHARATGARGTVLLELHTRSAALPP